MSSDVTYVSEPNVQAKSLKDILLTSQYNNVIKISIQ